MTVVPLLRITIPVAPKVSSLGLRCVPPKSSVEGRVVSSRQGLVVRVVVPPACRWVGLRVVVVDWLLLGVWRRVR